MMKTNHDESEEWLTDWLLGELPASEAARMKERVEQDPGLARLAGELRGVDRLINETEWSVASWVGWELPAEKRKVVLEKLGEVCGPTCRAKTRGIRPVHVITAVAACVALALAGVWYLNESPRELTSPASDVESIKSVTSADEAKEWADAITSTDDLRRAVEIQEKVLEEKRSAWTAIVRTPELYPWRSGNGVSMTVLAEEEIKLEAQIEMLLNYDDEQLMRYAAGLRLPENVVRSLYPEYLEAKRQLNAMKLGGLGKAHPNVRQQQEIVDAMRNDLDEAVVALRGVLRAQLELAKEQLERLEKKQEQLKEAPPAVDIVAFDAAREDFERASEVLGTLYRALEAREAQNSDEARDEPER